MQLETAAGYAGLRSYSVTQCPPTPLRDGCVLPIPKGALCGGLAIDETRGLVWVSVTIPGATTSRNFVRAHSLANKCKAICEIELPRCGPPLLGSDVLGLAYDPCSERLFATFGLWTLRMRVVDPLKCALKIEHCCDKGLTGRWRGLAVRPRASAIKFGRACIGKGCPFCSGLAAAPFGGVPAIGNRHFGIELSGAPLPSSAILIVGAGRCTKGLGLPFLCGAIYPSLHPPTFFLGPLACQGSGQCTGKARAPLPIPADAKLCGVRLCLEWVVVCGAISGFGLSDTWELEIG